MVMDTAVRLNLWMERHARPVAFATTACFALVCADYARFIDLPEIVTLPVMVTGILSGLRYALWEGWLKREVQARTLERKGEAPPFS